MESIGPVLYVAVKAVAYMAWCGLGARLHGDRERLWLKGILYGFFRLAMGCVLGLILIYLLVNALAITNVNPVLLYLAVYVPVRWLEWSALAVVMDRNRESLARQFLRGSPSSIFWRVGGIVISCLADIPMMIAMGGLPIGRFMC
jgi:hypothetical protein